MMKICRTPFKKFATFLAGFTVLALVAILGDGAPAATAGVRAASQTPQTGGTMTVLETSGYAGAWPMGLDPATDTSDAADDPYMEAIYGDLFQPETGGKMVPDLATGYKFTDGGKNVDIFLRHGVTFQDGTSFNAAAVQWNIQRDLDPKNACICDSSFPVSSVTTSGNYTVVMHLKQVFAPIIEAFAEQAPDWIASPTAVAKMGEKNFESMPVGAGPFAVSSDVLNSTLTLKKFNNYWQKGHPYLNGLVFKSIGNDQAAVEAMLAGDGQMEQFPFTFSVVQAAMKNPKLHVDSIPGAGPLGIQMNTAIAPFNNIKAREAIYYATDSQALNKVLSGGLGKLTESMDGPGSLFPELKVPGYRTYDLAKAKALVQQLGGLNFTILGGSGNPVATEALVSEWSAAGMHVTISTVNLAQLVAAFENKSWQLTVDGGGSADPAIGLAGMSWRVASNAPFTGIHDPHLDKLINEGTGTLNLEKRSQIYKQIFQYLSNNALLAFTYTAPGYTLATPNAHGPGVSTNQIIPLWQDTWLSH
jgi:ABC-type transport system substrate-binding protein